MIVITDRDKEIKEFLEDVEVADTKTIHEIFFNGTCIRNCQKRLKQLTNIKFIKSYRENTISQNIYYVKNRDCHPVFDLLCNCMCNSLF